MTFFKERKYIKVNLLLSLSIIYNSIFMFGSYGYSRVHFKFRISDPIFCFGSDPGPDLKIQERIGFGSKIQWIRSTLKPGHLKRIIETKLSVRQCRMQIAFPFQLSNFFLNKREQKITDASDTLLASVSAFYFLNSFLLLLAFSDLQ